MLNITGERKSLSDKYRFGSKSQKVSSKKTVPTPVNRTRKIFLEYKYQVACYKLSDGKILESNFSKDGSPDYMDVFPGTYLSADFLAHVHAHFLYAYDLGGDLDAKRMFEHFGWLYGQEDVYL